MMDHEPRVEALDKNLGLHEILLAQEVLMQKLSEENDGEKRKKLIIECIELFDVEKRFIVPEFDPNMQWLNTSRPLNVQKDFIGKITVLDFFTYCCINCMHILPDLEFIEKEYPQESGVLVVGVHSAKFLNEKPLENVANAILRHNIKHPVVNDPSGDLWNHLMISCWPTLMVLGPAAQVLFILTGEGNREMLQLIIECCLAFYRSKSQIKIGEKLPMQLLHLDKSKDSLLFPGKVAYCREDGRLAVSDTGHHRIVLVSPDGFIRTIIGGPEPGFADGSFEEARFRSPQGIVWKSDKILFVADMENHAIRQVCMVSNTVTTLAGNGMQGFDTKGDVPGTEVLLSSPWGLCMGEWNSDGTGKDILLIAMAGTHQIWGYALEESKLIKGDVLRKGICKRLAGSGKEGNKNNTYPLNASFAQPSGICIGKDSSGKAWLLVADSESSAIRMINLENWAVQRLAGGDIDPENLFCFGDQDGTNSRARLQHPMGVCWSTTKSLLFVADTFNHKIKHVDLITKMCKTFAGTGIASDHNVKMAKNMAMFNEPGGVCLNNNEDKLYVADTNNHCIKVLDLLEHTVEKLAISFIDLTTLKILDEKVRSVPDIPRRFHKNKHAVIIPLESIQAAGGADLSITVNLILAPGVKMNAEAPSRWTMLISSITGEEPSEDGRFEGQVAPMVQTFQCNANLPLIKKPEMSYTLELECLAHICDNKGRCFRKFVTFCAPVVCKDEWIKDDVVKRVAEYILTTN